MRYLFSNRKFMLVWISGMAVMLGFSIFFLSISWLTIDVLKNPGALGIIMTAVSLPRVVMMIFGGVLADRYQKTALMFYTNLGQAAIMGIMVYLYMTEGFSVPALLLISACFGILDAISYPAISSLIPSLVKSSELQRANSLVQGSTELMFAAGPFLAGALLSVGDFSVSFGTSGALILLSAILIFPPFIKDHKPDRKVLTLKSVLVDLKEGFRYVSASPVLRTGTLSIAIVNLFVMGPLIMSIPIIVGKLKGTPFDLSIMEGGLAAGTFAASLLMLRLNKRGKRGRLVFRALFMTGVAFLLYSQFDSIPLLALMAAISGFMLMLVYLPAVTLMQENSEQEKLGRVMSIMSLAAGGLEPIAFALLSVLVAASIPIQYLIAGSAVLAILSSVMLYGKSKPFLKKE
ncbi:MFS transporter [Bacillus mangrovi]|uniref:MFS transporter n=1 Tax=Metabacillus mangrovi TaxID=1491830 RepID=A0A7X2S373_9BACI|nr:MFS transporter [Metabacillus mangrovi]MTH52848.1 MFS transporter [Metabacillus mangrovi]